MRWRQAGLLLVLWAAVGPLAGCGENKLDRGVPVGEEQAVPESSKQLSDTAVERRKEEERQDAKKLRKEFDAAEQEASGGS